MSNYQATFSKAISGRVLPGILVLAFLATFAMPLRAQVVWDNGTGVPNPYYHTGSNWVGNSAPGPAATAQFDINGTYDVWWNATTESLTPQVGILHVIDGDVTFRSTQLTALRKLTINGSGGSGLNSDFSVSGTGTSLSLFGVHMHSLGGAEILDGASVIVGAPGEASSQITVDGARGFDVSGNLLLQGGSIDGTNAFIAKNSGSIGSATITGAGRQWNSILFQVGTGGSGTLNIQLGGAVSSQGGSIGYLSSGIGVATISNAGSAWNSNDISVGYGGSGTLIIESGGAVSSQVGYIGRLGGSVGVATISDTGSTWNNSGSLVVGSRGSGTLNIESGGAVSCQTGYIGFESSGVGVATISGTGSNWNSSLNLFVGYGGSGTLNIESGGVASNGVGFIAEQSGAIGSVAVDGANSAWNVLSSLYVGRQGNGMLEINNGGVVSNTNGYIANSSTSVGTAIVSGTNSRWNNSANLYIGGSSSSAGGTGTLNINNGGLVTVNGTTKIWSTGTVNLTGGRFEFGETTLAEFGSINGVSGSMAGNLNHSSFTDVGNLTSLQNLAVDLTEVTLTNSGTLHGSATLGNSLINETTGELFTLSGHVVRFGGYGDNSGEINNFGGAVRFEQSLINQASGFISGRGAFTAIGEIENHGVMAFSGSTDVLGDVANMAGGVIVTSGGATTTFHDDVLHNGVEIRTAAISNSVFFGGVSGSGAFTGTGTVFFEGDLRPGNSPDIVGFEGNVVFGSGAGSYFELGGLDSGDFDQLLIDGNLDVDGQLFVSLINGFQLGANQEFLIADVGGSLNGMFAGLGEGDLVGNFGGRDLFITYEANGGGNIGLFTAVPEPSTAGLLALALVSGLLNRRRRRMN